VVALEVLFVRWTGAEAAALEVLFVRWTGAEAAALEVLFVRWKADFHQQRSEGAEEALEGHWEEQEEQLWALF